MKADLKAKWQPIETAPKDGTRILIAVDGDMYVAAWDAQFYSDWDEDAGTVAHRGAWSDDSAIPAVMSPTHWLPLPAPPEIADEIERLVPVEG